MRSRRIFFGALIIGVGVGLMMTAPVSAQSVNIGNGLINVLDVQGDTVFNVGSGNDVNIGGTGADVDIIAWSSTGSASLSFNTSSSALILGSSGNAGDWYLFDPGVNAYTAYAYGSYGDMYLGNGTVDGDLLIRDAAGSYTILADGGSGNLTLGGGAQAGDIILKDATTGLTNFNAQGGYGTLTLGSFGTAGDAGELYIRDSNGTTNNVAIYGTSGDLHLGSGASGDDGDILLHDGSSLWGVQLAGSSGTVYNKSTGNGIVKAWARINSTGTISSSYRTNTSASETRKVATGQYEVDFFPSYFNTYDRPVLCTIGHSGSTAFYASEISCTQRSGDPSSIYVVTRHYAGSVVDSNFTIVIF